MKQLTKTGAKIFYNYAMSLIVFLIFLYPFMGLTKDKLHIWLPVYSIVIFLFAFFLIYNDMKDLAIKEKRPQYNLNPYPFKGLVCGLISIIPLSLIAAASGLLHFENATADRIKHVAVNAILGPLYFMIKLFNESVAGYAAAILLIPLVAMLGYLAGFYGINLIKKKEVVQEKGFTKSPWNPTAAIKKGSSRKKKKNTVSGGK